MMCACCWCAAGKSNADREFFVPRSLGFGEIREYLEDDARNRQMASTGKVAWMLLIRAVGKVDLMEEVTIFPVASVGHGEGYSGFGVAIEVANSAEVREEQAALERMESDYFPTYLSRGDDFTEPPGTDSFAIEESPELAKSPAKEFWASPSPEWETVEESSLSAYLGSLVDPDGTERAWEKYPWEVGSEVSRVDGVQGGAKKEILSYPDPFL